MIGADLIAPGPAQVVTCEPAGSDPLAEVPGREPVAYLDGIHHVTQVVKRGGLVLDGGPGP